MTRLPTRVGVFAERVRDVSQRKGELVVLTERQLHIGTEKYALPPDCRGDRVFVLSGERFAIHSWAGPLLLGTPDRWVSQGNFGWVERTRLGLVAGRKGEALFVGPSDSRVIPTSHHGAIATSRGPFLYGMDGWSLHNDHGKTLARGGGPVADAALSQGQLFYADGERLRVLDLFEPKRQRGLPIDLTKMCAAWGGVLCVSPDAVRFFDASKGDVAFRWRVEVPFEPCDVALASGFAVVAFYGSGGVILDKAQREWTGPSSSTSFRNVASLDGGVVFAGSSSVHWSPKESVELDQDFTPDRLLELPMGVATLEDNVVRIFQPPGASVPTLGAPASSEFAVPDPPLGETFVVNGMVGKRIRSGRYVYEFERRKGGCVRVARGTEYRSCSTKEQALAVMAKLASRSHDEASEGVEADAFRVQQRIQDLLVSTDEREPLLFEELALVLSVDARLLSASAWLGRFPLAAPVEAPRFEFLGTIESSGQMVACDPCYRHVKERSVRLDLPPGEWSAYALRGQGRTREVWMVHGAGMPSSYVDLRKRVLRSHALVVDSGIIGVYDEACDVPTTLEWTDKPACFRGKAVHSPTVGGDGLYGILVAVEDSDGPATLVLELDR
ncbi:MAG: hypothetical protein AAGE52_34045 [Myxococcota bacterium]